MQLHDLLSLSPSTTTRIKYLNSGIFLISDLAARHSIYMYGGRKFYSLPRYLYKYGCMRASYFCKASGAWQVFLARVFLYVLHCTGITLLYYRYELIPYKFFFSECLDELLVKEINLKK